MLGAGSIGANAAAAFLGSIRELLEAGTEVAAALKKKSALSFIAQQQSESPSSSLHSSSTPCTHTILVWFRGTW